MIQELNLYNNEFLLRTARFSFLSVNGDFAGREYREVPLPYKLSKGHRK